MNLAELFRHESDLLILSAGQTLFKEGEHGDLMYVLMSGIAEISIKGRVVEFPETGAIVGEMAMIDDGARSATVAAKTECKFLPIDRKRFNFLVQQTPNFALHVMRVTADRLRRTDRML
ncbi:MAG: cyclic nucleotide-binding domain-containing protein [Nitrosomonadales bacterium]|nr:cyclic nucleotide-binding domain-containing protein [Nitrosomonadales bacterium]